MSTVPSNEPYRERIQPGAGAALVYWVLVLMGVATFAPCVLYPEWRHFEQLRAVEQAERQRVDGLREQLKRERQSLDAIRSDPAVIARLAQRELRYRKPDERMIRVEMDAAADVPRDETVPAAESTLPSWAGAVAHHLPDVDYDDLLLDRKSTTILMTLSVALIAVAVGFVSRRPSLPTVRSRSRTHGDVTSR